LAHRRAVIAGALSAFSGAAFAQPAPITTTLSNFVANRDAAIPEPILELGRLHILDGLASMVACRDLEPATVARRYALAQGGGARTSTILPTRQRTDLVDAVFAGAMTAHAAEINDFIPSAFVQPGPAILSAALGLAEQRGSNGTALLKAVIVGYEIAGRVPKALGNDNLRRANLANHAIGPVFGTAATAASLIGLSPEQIAEMWSFCAQQAGGSWQWTLDVEHIEKSFVFAGKGARDGLQAALMIEGGFRGVRDSLDNPAGWLKSAIFTGGDANPGYLTGQLGQRWELTQTAFKRYPTGGPTQPAVHGLLELLPKIDRRQVEHVRIEMPGSWQTFRDAAMPALSLPYLTAVILADGKLDFVAAQSLPRMRTDAAVRALMAKVEVAHDPAQEAPTGQPRTESARVIVTMADGKRVEAFTPFVPGYPSHPMDRAQVEAKALELMTPRLGAARARAVVAQVADLGGLKRADRLIGMIAS
jgi:2-methylcitrate dehydratase PrpD